MGEGMQEKKAHKMVREKFSRSVRHLLRRIGRFGAPRAVVAALALLVVIAPFGGDRFARAAELVLVSQPGCGHCTAWKNEIGPIYPKTAEGEVLPLREVVLRSAEAKALDLVQPVTMTPTFLLVDQGRELSRVTGYSGQELFWWQLQVLMKALP